MAYSNEFQGSLRKIEASRNRRRRETFPKLNLAEKSALLETYHPDFRIAEKREIQIGPTRGGMAPRELVDLLDSPSRLIPEAIDLAKVAHKTDVLVIGGGGAGVTAALTAKECGAQVLLATKLRLGDSNTIMAEGGIAAATLPEDSPVIHYVDTIMGGRGKNIPELVGPKELQLENFCIRRTHRTRLGTLPIHPQNPLIHPMSPLIQIPLVL